MKKKTKELRYFFFSYHFTADNNKISGFGNVWFICDQFPSVDETEKLIYDSINKKYPGKKVIVILGWQELTREDHKRWITTNQP